MEMSVVTGDCARTSVKVWSASKASNDASEKCNCWRQQEGRHLSYRFE